MRQIHYIRYGLLLPLIFLLLSEGYAQQLITRVSPDSVEVGGLIPYTLVLQTDREYDEIVYPDSLSFPPELSIRQRQQYKVSDFKDSLRYTLQNFGNEDIRINPLPVLLIAGNDTIRLMTDPVLIPFRSVTNDESTLQELKPLFAFPAPLWPWLLAGLILAAGFWYWWTYHRNRPEKVKEEPIRVPPFSDPLEKLEKDLHHHRSALNPVVRESVKNYYSGISDAIRSYFEHIYRIPALESTSRELLRYLDVYGVDEQIMELTRQIVREADLVKFAKYDPDENDHLSLYNRALEFLDRAQSVDRSRIKRLKQEYEERHGLTIKDQEKAEAES